MKRIIFAIIVLLSIYYLYKQNKKLKKSMDKLNTKINLLEKQRNSGPIKDLPPSSIQSNGEINNDISSTKKNDNPMTCDINGQCTINSVQNENTIQEDEIQNNLSKFFQKSSNLNNIIPTNIESMGSAAFIISADVQSPVSNNNQNIVEIDTVNSDSEISLHSESESDFEKEQLSNLMNANGLASLDENIDRDFDQNLQNLINSDTISNIGDGDGEQDNTDQSDINYTINTADTETTEQSIINNVKNDIIDNIEQNTSTPVVENHESIVENVEPVAVNTESIVENVEPVAVNTESIVENVEPVAVNTESIVDSPKPVEDKVNANNSTFKVVTKKYAQKNSDKCCAIKKFGTNIGHISNTINVPAIDYIFVEYQNKSQFEENLSRASFDNNIILSKSNLSNYIY